MRWPGELRGRVYLVRDEMRGRALALQHKLPGNTLRDIFQSWPFRSCVSLVALCVAVFTTYHRFHTQTVSLCTTDFYSYYLSAVRLGHGVAPYTGLATWIRDHAATSAAVGPYTDASCAAGTILEYFYTPFLGYLLLPFTWLPFNTALAVWDICNLLFLGGALYAFLSAARVSPSASWLLVLTVVAMFLSPLRFDLYYAQLDVFLLCIVCIAFWARVEGHTVLAGALLAVACACAPLLLLIVGFLLWKREMKLAASATIGSVALILTPFLWLGGQSLQDMLLIWRFYSGSYAVTFTNDAPRGVFLRLSTAPLYLHPLTAIPLAATVLWLLIAAAAACFTLTRLARRPIDRNARSVLEIGLVVGAILLISPWSENGQFTWLILPFLAVYASIRHLGFSTPAARWLLIGFAVALLMLLLIGDDAQIAFLTRAGESPRFAPLLVILAATYLYPLFVIAGATMYAQRLLASDSAGTSGDPLDASRWTQAKRVHIVGGRGRPR